MRQILILTIFFGFAIAQEISIWTSFTGLELDWLNSQSQLYSELFKQEVKISNYNIGEIKQKMILSKTDSSILLADLIVGLSSDQVPVLSKENLLTDIHAFTTQDYLNDLYKNARESFTFDKKLFGFPLYLEGPALIINRDLLSKTPISFEDIIALNKQSESEATAFRFDISNLYFAYPFLTSYGAKLFVDGEINIEDANFIKGAEFLRDLKFKYGLFEHTSYYKEVVEDFYYSKQMMIYDGPWSLKTYAQANLNLIVMPLPATETGLELNGLTNVYGLMLTNKTEANINAINLAKWLSRPEAQLALSEATDKIPSSKEATNNLDNELIIGFARALARADVIPNDSKMANSWGPITNAMFTIFVSVYSNLSGIFKQAAQDINQAE